MKRIRCLLIFILMLFLPINISLAKEVPEHDSNYFIDELGVLSDSSKQIINNQNLPDGAQIFVLTVDNMDEDPFDYGMKAFKKYQLGDKEKDNGLLVLLARTSEGKHHIRVITGYGLEGILPDGKVGRIIDNYMMDDFYKDDLDKGLIKGFNEFNRIIKDNNNKDNSEIETVEGLKIFNSIMKINKVPKTWQGSKLYIADNKLNVNISNEEILKKVVEFQTFAIIIVASFFIHIIFLILGIIEKKRNKKIEKMAYNDFIKNDEDIDLDDYEYYKRFEEVSASKGTEEIKSAIKQAKTFKRFFKDDYIYKKSEDLMSYDLEQLIKDAEWCDEIDKSAYDFAIYKKLKDIGLDSIKDYTIKFSNTSSSDTIKTQYQLKILDELKKSSFDDLEKLKINGKDELLNERDYKDIVKEALRLKVKELDEEEFEKIKDKATDKDLIYYLEEEEKYRERKREIEIKEERNRRIGSIFSSSGSGGFSGGGGSSGGGGAGRSF